MKNLLKVIGLTLALSLSMISCDSTKKETANVEVANVEKTTLHLEGMTCEGCVATITKKLKKAEGVSAANVDLESRTAEVTFDSKVSSREKLAELVKGIDGGKYSVNLAKSCAKDCKKACCTDKVAVKSCKKACEKDCKKDCKKSCSTKSEVKSCEKDCKKACCTEKSEVKSCEKDCKKACCTEKK